MVLRHIRRIMVPYRQSWTSLMVMIYIFLSYGNQIDILFFNERARDCAYFIDREEEYKPGNR